MSKIDAHKPGTPSWFDLMTPDIDGAKRFYGGLFGWSFETGGPETAFYTMCRVGDRNAAGMGKQPENAPFPTVWTVYLASENVEADAARVKEHGGSVMMGPMDVMEEGRLAVCTDPTGAVFGMWQPRRHGGAQIANEHGSMTWCEVATRDASKARDFYTTVFGLEGRKMEGAGVEYYTLHKDKETAAGILQMNEQWPANLPPHWMPYFAVDDADAAVERVTELGGKVHNGPFDMPYGRMAVVSDPYGAVFTLIKPSQAAMEM
ncbi:VOC family protein [Polyangium aurulentum]|uniref:VOC family protein n=1 Tax=Polyangium aurulentum TaxID=2567896 RepID=UPI001F48A958|nr:VOC family protein [Polyangium aurulentum]